MRARLSPTAIFARRYVGAMPVRSMPLSVGLKGDGDEENQREHRNHDHLHEHSHHGDERDPAPLEGESHPIDCPPKVVSSITAVSSTASRPAPAKSIAWRRSGSLMPDSAGVLRSHVASG